MRWLPKAIPVSIAIIVLDLAVVFGFESWRIFTSPVYGLDQIAFSHVVYGIGALTGLKGVGLYKIAAFFGALYLATAVVLVLHLESRVRALRGGRISHDLLDAGLILVVFATLVFATPAILRGATEILIQERLPLWLVGLAATLSMIERLPEADNRKPGLFERLGLWFVNRRKPDDAIVVSPVVRNDTAAIRWDGLRSEAGMMMRTARAEVEGRPYFGLRGR